MQARLVPVVVASLVAACAATPKPASEFAPGIARTLLGKLEACGAGAADSQSGLQTLVDAIVAQYDPRALFWPTTSRIPAIGQAEVRKYFEPLCKNYSAFTSWDRKFFDDSEVVYGDAAVAVGVIATSGIRDGKPAAITTRYSFTARKSDGKWLIIQHHSSLLPAAPR